MKTLKPPTFTDEERAQLVTDLLALKKTQIADFLARIELKKSGTKEEIRTRIEEGLNDGTISLSKIVEFLDEVIPWGKQHVYMYKGPLASIAKWKNAKSLANLLKKHGCDKYLNATLPLALPKNMTISSILHDGLRLRITAIKKREWWERSPEYDEAKETAEGEEMKLRAFVRRVTRSLVAFDWDLIANVAALHISQLPAGVRYDEVAQEFFNLVAKWLDISRFLPVDLRPAIKKLHELEEAGTPEARSHGINYRTLQGRRFEGRSASPADSLFGETTIDAAMSAVRNSGVGHLGNFYWLNGSTNGIANPLDGEVHVIIVGAEKRVNFPTPNEKQVIQYVLSRIRGHSP